MNKEIVGTSAVENILARTDLLVTNINKNDKLPTWDGEIYVYKDSDKSKNCLLGRVPVQIKCEEDNRNTTNTLYWQYPVKLSDLQNYYNEGGVIYFVVKTDKLTETIYYKALLPADLFPIIENYGKQKQRNIGFKKFPTNLSDAQSIFIDFLTHRDWQSSIKQIGIKTPEELHKAGYTRPFFNVRAQNIYDVVGQEIYSYLKNPIGAIACSGIQVIEKLLINDPTAKLKVAENIYFIGSKTEQDIKQLKLSFGNDENVSLIFKNKVPELLSLHPAGTLDDHINCFEFAIAATKNNGFSINNAKFSIGSNNETDKIFQAAVKNEFTSNLNILYKIKYMFSAIGVNKNIKLTDISFINNLYFIACSLLDKKAVNITNVNETGLLRVLIRENEYILFRLEQKDNNSYIVHELFKVPPPPIRVKTQQNEVLLTENDNSYFLLLHEKDFYSILNFDIDAVQNDVLKYLNKDDGDLTANFILIHYWFKLLKAFDVTKNVLFLDKAHEVLEELKTIKGISKSLIGSIFLNELQIIKRVRPFNDSELDSLNKFIEESDIDEQLVGAYLLQDDMTNAKIKFNGLDNRTKEYFKAYPIYKFWQD